MVDETNKSNIKMFFLYMFVVFGCIVIILVMGILVGNSQPKLQLNSFDRPRASICFHDHRL